MTTTATTTATKWAIDPKHSEVQFKVKHLMISNVSGTFKVFNGSVESESEDFNNAHIHFEIDTNSVDTNLEERDGHLKSPLFLDAQKYSHIIFDGIMQKKAGEYQLAGDVTIHGVKKSITMEVEHTGLGKGRFGDSRAGFEVNGKINRKDFELNASILTETGSMVVGEEVKLHFDIQLIKQA